MLDKPYFVDLQVLIQIVYEQDGMRDGLHDGKENSLQQGFDLSYCKSFNITYSYARLRGILMLSVVLAVPSRLAHPILFS